MNDECMKRLLNFMGQGGKPLYYLRSCFKEKTDFSAWFGGFAWGKNTNRGLCPKDLRPKERKHGISQKVMSAKAKSYSEGN